MAVGLDPRQPIEEVRQPVERALARPAGDQGFERHPGRLGPSALDPRTQHPLESVLGHRLRERPGEHAQRFLVAPRLLLDGDEEDGEAPVRPGLQCPLQRGDGFGRLPLGSETAREPAHRLGPPRHQLQNATVDPLRLRNPATVPRGVRHRQERRRGAGRVPGGGHRLRETETVERIRGVRLEELPVGFLRLAERARSHEAVGGPKQVAARLARKLLPEVEVADPHQRFGPVRLRPQDLLEDRDRLQEEAASSVLRGDLVVVGAGLPVPAHPAQQVAYQVEEGEIPRRPFREALILLERGLEPPLLEQPLGVPASLVEVGRHGPRATFGFSGSASPGSAPSCRPGSAGRSASPGGPSPAGRARSSPRSASEGGRSSRPPRRPISSGR